MIRNEGNFLVRTRSLFAQQGLAALVLDAPSDQASGMSRAHESDPCPICDPGLLRDIKLPARGKIIMEHGGVSTGDPCEAFSHHGYNGIEGTVVADVSAFIIGH